MNAKISPAGAPADVPPTILVIDDAVDNLQVIGEILSAHYRVRSANSGPAGLRAAETEPRPDLILLDIMMPGMDGYEVMRQLAVNRRSASIPVIFVTVMGEDADEEYGLSLGAVDYLSKPIHPAILLARVRTHLELKRHQDILKRQNDLLEARVRERVETLRAILDSADQSILMMAPEGVILAANRIAAERLGTTPERMVGRNLSSFLSPELAAARWQKINAIAASGQPGSFEDDRDGRHFHTRVFPIAGFPPRLVIYATDITEQRRQAQRRQAAHDRAEALLAIAAQDGVLNEHDFLQFGLEQAERLTGSQIAFLHFVNADQQTIELLAWSRATLERFCHVESLDTHYPISAAGVWAEAFRQRQPVVINDYPNLVGKHGLPEGHAHLDRLISLPVMAEGQVRVIMGVGNKASEYDDYDVQTVQLIGNDLWRVVTRQRSERQLREALQVVEASPVVCFRWRAEPGWPIDYVSQNVRQWGYTAADLLEGRPPFSALVHPDDIEQIAREVAAYTAEGRSEYVQAYRLLTADGRAFWIEDHTRVIRDADGTPRFYEGVVHDIDADRRAKAELAANLEAQRALNRKLEEAQNQLLQSEKMASIGQLAAGVAHELNNPIGFVYSNMGSLEGYLKDLFAIADAFGEAAKQVPEAQAPIAAALALMQEKDYAFLKEDIGQLMDESKDGLARVRKIVQDLKDFSRVGEAQWQWADLHAGLDSTLNIVWNELKYKCKVHKVYGELPPVYCLPSQLNQVFMNLLVNAGHAIDTQGDIYIRTGRDGEQVWVEIEDSGHGIPEENLNRIFEPFYTTKPVGKGTGLGLSLAYGIVAKHQGRIEVDSTVGQGTRFRVWLPIEPELTDAAETPNVD